MAQAVTPPVVQLCKPRVSTCIVRRGTGADEQASSVVRILHGGPGRAGLSAGLWLAWDRAVTISGGRGHPQAERVGGESGGGRWEGAHRPRARERLSGSGEDSRRKGLHVGVARVRGDAGGREEGRGEEPRASLTRAEKWVQSWLAPSVARLPR